MKHHLSLCFVNIFSNHLLIGLIKNVWPLPDQERIGETLGREGTSVLGQSLSMAAVATVGVKDQEARNPIGVTLSWGERLFVTLHRKEKNAGS